MADQAYEFNVNAIDWTARDTTWIPADGDMWWFYNHPDYKGLVYLYGNDVNVTGSLNVYAAPWQFKSDGITALSPTATFIDQRICAFAASATSLRVSVDIGNIPLSSATTMTFPAGFTFRTSNNVTIYTVTASETAPVTTIVNNYVTATITTTGLTAGLSGFAVGANMSVALS